MEIGLHLPSAQPGAEAAGILEVARAAEEMGFDSVWMFDHLFTPVDLSSAYPYSRDGSYPLSAQDPYFDPIGLFGVLAGTLERVKMGTGVLIPAYRNPIVLGKVLASVENFAPGRIVLGVGAGWMREEFDAVGVDHKTRGRRLEEYVGALRAVWSGRSAFDGEFYSWVESGFLPAPTAPIPLIFGGHSDAALRRAARVGDGWAIVTDHTQGRGLDAMAARIEDLEGFLDEQGRGLDGFELLLQHALMFLDEPNPKLPFAGTPEDIAKSLDRARALGVTMVDLVILGPPSFMVETATRFSEEVRPLL